MFLPIAPQFLVCVYCFCWPIGAMYSMLRATGHGIETWWWCDCWRWWQCAWVVYVVLAVIVVGGGGGGGV